MKGFKIGDRVAVKFTSQEAKNHRIKIGQTGVVIHFLNGSIGVRMDEHNTWLSSLNLRCEHGHGYYFEDFEIEFAKEPLENWTHPHFRKPILVRYFEDSEWKERSFLYHDEGSEFPIVVENEDGAIGRYKLYKFQDEVPSMTKEEAQAKFKIRIVD